MMVETTEQTENFTPTNLEKYQIVPHKRKAGLFIIGDADVKGSQTGEKRLHVIAPWIEGAFEEDEGYKAYFIPKGSLDDGEKGDMSVYVYKKDENGREQLDVEATREQYEAAGGRLYTDYAGAWDGAKREVEEETGISIDEILRSEIEGVSIEGLKEGEVPKPVFEDFCPSHRGNPNLHTMFAVRVKGIEKLDAHLKFKQNNNDKTVGDDGRLKFRQNNNENQPTVGDDGRSNHIRLARRKDPKAAKLGRLSEDKYLAREGRLLAEKGDVQLPPLEDFLKILRTGMWHLGPDAAHNGRLFDRDFSKYEQSRIRQMVDEAFSDLVERADKKDMALYFRTYFDISTKITEGQYTISNLSELKAAHPDIFMHWKEADIEPRHLMDEIYHHASCQDTLKGNMKAIRKHMEVLGIVADKTGLKMDTKHRPLTYYQEGADIIPFDEYLVRTLKFAEKNPLYEQSQFNAHMNDREPGKWLNQRGKSYADLLLETAEKLNIPLEWKTGKDGFARVDSTGLGIAVNENAPNLPDAMRKLVDKITEEERQRLGQIKW